MARNDDEDDDDLDEDEQPLSDDSLKALQDVRKGKSRGFVLLRKGAKILCLVVYKRGNAEKYVKEAKKQGTGQVFFGVVAGKGTNLTFRLSRRDGFDKDPVKKLVLRDFLNDEGDIKAKPIFEIVDQLDKPE